MLKREIIRQLASKWDVPQQIAAARYADVCEVFKTELLENNELRVGDLFRIEVKHMPAAKRYNIATKQVEMAAPRIALKATRLKGLY